MFRVYGDIQSGNCYKIKLLTNYLRVAHEWVHVDVLEGGTRTQEFLAKNANGRIPVLELPDGRCLTESNAILNYLAQNTVYLPDDPWLRAQVLQWQFFEQYSHEPYIAVARFIDKFLGLPAERRAEYEAKQEGGKRALGVMQHHLSHSSYFVGDAVTIADISLYAYTHVAHEGGFDLSGLPAIRGWLLRIESQPRHITMAEAAA